MTSVEFLKKFHKDGLWVLTAIKPNQQGTDTKTFTPKQAKEAEKWIKAHNDKANIYFSVNQPAGPISKKATKAQIKTVGWFHVDLDARKNEPLGSELERIRLLLTEKLPPTVPPPTFIVFSGGGYQAFWRLAQPIEVTDPVQIERYNKHFEFALGGDKCHNIDRIMRLPNTWNLPSAIKVERGRERALAEVHDYQDLAYSLSDFTPSPGGTSDVPLEALSIGDINDLDRWKVPARVKVIIVQGNHPDEPKDGDNSRSVWLFDALCEMVRRGVPDEVILGIILDLRFQISESVLDKGKNAKAYAQRQITQAHGEVGDDPVAWVNARYFAAMEGGKVAFYREENDGSVSAMNSQSFKFELAPKQTEEKTPRPYSSIWIPSPRRRYYPRGFVLTPNSPPEGFYNLWRGFAVEPQPGDWSRMRDHIYEVLASGNQEHGEYILRWTAWSVQNPHVPPRVALVFRSDEEGVGKGAFCNALVELFGTHGLRIQHMSHLTGKFNAHQRHCCLLFADEAVTTEDDGVLKGLITEPTMAIERKGYDVVQASNHLHLVMSSNSQWVLPVGTTARRYAIFEVSPKYKGNLQYFTQLFDEECLPGMLHEMLNMDLGNWHPEAYRPDTTALNIQKAASLPPLEAVWYEVLYSGEMPCGKAWGEGWLVFTSLFRDYVDMRFRRPDITFNAVAALFKRLGYQQHRKSRPSGWLVPSVVEARTVWDKVMFLGEWTEVGDWCLRCEMENPGSKQYNRPTDPDNRPFER